jgi:iron-sulfur cluster repair protein YtfE (RIC family)
MYIKYIFNTERRQGLEHGAAQRRKGMQTMSTLTEAVRKHHRSLAGTLEAHARGAGRNELQVEREAFVAFLKGDLMPHARSEERHLYPLVDELVRNHGRATATMTVDHEFIADYVSRIEQTTSELATTMDAERRERLAQSLHDLALQLDAIVKLHRAKEERVYLPLIAEHVDETRQGNVLHAVQESYERGRNGSGR